MAPGDFPGSLKHIVLLALLRRSDNACRVAARGEIETRAGNSSIGSIYALFERLEAEDLVGAHLGGPRAARARGRRPSGRPE